MAKLMDGGSILSARESGKASFEDKADWRGIVLKAMLTSNAFILKGTVDLLVSVLL